MNPAAAARFALFGTLLGAAWSVLNTFLPNSSGSTAGGDFVVLHPLLHRLEHLSAALLVYPALFLALYAYQAGRTTGRGVAGRVPLAVAGLAAAAAMAASLTEAFVLQSPLADTVRAYGLVLCLLLLAPLLMGLAALLARTAPFSVRLWPLGLVAVFIVATILAASAGAADSPLVTAGILLAWAGFAAASGRRAAAFPHGDGPHET